MRTTGTLILLLSTVFACSRAQGDRQDRGEAPGKETDPVNAKSGQAIASSSAVAAAEAHGNRVEGPRDENMGRNFEGRLQFKVVGLAQPLEIRYLSRAERGRLQIDRQASSFDAIFAGDQALVLDHAHHGYRTFDLNTVPKKSEPDEKVTIERTSDRKEVSGLLCYPWRLSSGSQKIEACVRGLPGPFDTDKLETLSHLDIPAWVEQLLAIHYLPIEATVTEGGRKLYELQLVQYSPDQVPENELSIPANYRKL
ncbi:MAG TPA: DUF4412 domain-containing protein [Polyangiaceae bacterium]|nr:DUF4412 domain-containing protein [Polyangiaceae bacterium]